MGGQKILDKIRRMEEEPLPVEERFRLAVEFLKNGGEFRDRFSDYLQGQILSEVEIILRGSDEGVPGTDAEFAAAQRDGWSRTTGIRDFPAFPEEVNTMLQKVQACLSELRPAAEPGAGDEAYL